MAYRQIPSTFTLASTSQPQPLLGSWITAGAITTPTGVPTVVTLGNAFTAGTNDAAMFVQGEPALLVDPNGANMETVRIASVNIAGNTVTLGNSSEHTAVGGPNPVTRKSHVAGVIGTGTWIMPKQMANNFLVMYEDGGTGTFMYIGCSWKMTATAYRVFKMGKTTTGTPPYYYNSAMFSPGNPFDLSEVFIFGTSGDIYSVSVAID